MSGRQLATALIALTLMITVSPVGAAATSCGDEADAAAEGTYLYVRDDGKVEVWEESNGIDGLQTSACTGPNGRIKPADTHVQTLPPGAPNPDLTFCVPLTTFCTSPL